MSTPFLVITPSRLKCALALLGALGFVALGALLIWHGKGLGVVFGLLSVLFFGAGVPLIAREVFDPRPRVILDEAGVFDRTLGVGTIPWTDIQGASVKSAQGRAFVCLELRNTQEWLARLPALRRTLAKSNLGAGFPPFNINLTATSADPEAVLGVVLEQCAAHLHNTGPPICRDT